MKKETMNHSKKRPRDMKFKEFKKIYLIPYGFKFLRNGSGSHIIYVRECDNIIFPIPIHSGNIVPYCLVSNFKKRFVNKTKG